MAQSVHGKSAIVTGAGSGINFCFARLLLGRGCNVLLADLSLRPEAEALISSDDFAPARAIFQKTDVRMWVEVSRMFEVAIKEFGAIDIVCPGAGVFEPLWSNFWRPPGGNDSRDDVDGDRYALLDINITHPIRTTQLAISHFMAAEKKASPENPKTIVHISSVAGQTTPLSTPLYNASKYAINGFVRTLGPLEQELGIRVAAVAPGIVRTPLWTEHPEKFKAASEDTVWVTPEEVAEVMLALVEKDAIRSVVGGGEGGTLIPIRGGIVLEVSKTVREVLAYNDPGPEGRRGNVLENAERLKAEALELVRTPGWGT